MSKINDYFNKLINKILKRNNVKSLPPSASEQFLSEVQNSDVILDYRNKLINNEKLNYVESNINPNQSNQVYNLPLDSKLTETQAIELAKDFFNSFKNSFASNAVNVIDGNSDIEFKFVPYGTEYNENGPRQNESNFHEVYCNRNGDLTDLYGIVHEVTHTFDTKNGDTESRKVFGEILPETMERMLDEYLLNLSDDKLNEYGFSRNVLVQDIYKRKLSTFISRKKNIELFCNGNGRKDVDLRYILSQIYSNKLMQLDGKSRSDMLDELVNNIINDDMDACKKIFEMDLSNKLRFEMDTFNTINSAIDTYDNLLIKKKQVDILNQLKLGKNFKVSFGNQNIHFILDSNIPFILITPSHIEQNQTMVMETNNLEDSNFENLVLEALKNGKDLMDTFKGNTPILVPILPGESNPYYQQLSRECFNNGQRPDLDIVDVINKAKNIMQNEYDMQVNDKIFLNGYSTTGCFAQRFSLIHPELIEGACIGGSSGSIPIPTTKLDYPLGIRNFKEIFGKDFDMESYKKIYFDYYVGELEDYIKSNNRTDEYGNSAPMHDMSYFDKSVPKNVGQAQRDLLGANMFKRAEKTIEILKSIGIDIKHSILPRIIHNDAEAQRYMRDTGEANIHGIRYCQSDIIAKSFYGMIERRKQLNDKTVKNLENEENNEIINDKGFQR